MGVSARVGSTYQRDFTIRYETLKVPESFGSVDFSIGSLVHLPPPFVNSFHRLHWRNTAGFVLYGSEVLYFSRSFEIDQRRSFSFILGILIARAGSPREFCN